MSFLFAFLTAAAVVQATDYPSAQGFDRNLVSLQSAQCSELVETISGKRAIPDTKDNKPLTTSQFLVIKNGKAVLEWSQKPFFQMSNRSYLWSASKSLTATLVARAIQEKRRGPDGETLSLDSKIHPFFSESEIAKRPDADRFKSLTLRHLLTMGAGFEWQESYESDSDNSSFLPMLYTQGRFDMAAWARSKPLIHDPGTAWNYSGGNSLILMKILRTVYGKSDFYKDSLFNLLGMTSATYGQDKSGTPVGSSYAFMNIEDLARYGYLLLNKGLWNGQQVLPSWYLDWAVAPSEVYFHPKTKVTFNQIKKESALGNGVFWINKPFQGRWAELEEQNGKPTDKVIGWKTEYPSEFKSLPPDLYLAAGHYGQLVIVIPSENLVIARTGRDLEYWSKIETITAQTRSCLQESFK